MEGHGAGTVFYLTPPDLKKLLFITMTQQEEEEELRSQQLKTCRELLLLFSEVLASPALDSFTDITVVVAIPFYRRGFVQEFGERRRLQLGPPQRVSPGVLQSCMSYSLITRLSPSWNKAGLYLISGKDFLTKAGPMNAVSIRLDTSEGALRVGVEATAVSLPPPTLQDFNVPPSMLRRFCSDPDAVLHPTSGGGAVWCHVLPSMKRGQLFTLSRKLPPQGPFRTYEDLRRHWNRLYGYWLPELPEGEAVYCSVHFRPLGGRLFTYPLSCIRLQSLQRCSHSDQQGAAASFLSDLQPLLQSVCGLPAQLTRRPQQLLHSAPPAQQDGAHGLLGNGFRSILVCGGWPPSSPLPLLQPASSLSSSSSSSLLPPLTPPTHTPPPSLVPVFSRRPPNLGLPQEQQEDLGGGGAPRGGGAQRGRVSLPTFKTPAAPAAFRPLRFCNPPPIRRHRTPGRPDVKPESSLSLGPRPHPGTTSPAGAEQSRPGATPPPGAEVNVKVKSCLKRRPDSQPASGTEAPPPKKEVQFQPGLKKRRWAVKDVYVEQMARTNQLSQVNVATLTTWLTGRGVRLGPAHKKEELMLKVMSCLAEA
ncbi:uncharacterized protein C18orf63 homolog isoform X2 [Antennarius striatus]|uniref:uncharacterized protein C18orf63 homolog isoform X2 n=1 Tax=Antennarius striatus TaxID=241820 RepID=UPI0035B295B1